ncbi:histone-lysine N-methyltransferase SETD8-A, partial [Elysia marginata]
MKVMVQEGDQVLDKHRFIRLRNLICTRLTLFNARRGGEPARMLLSDWTDAEENAWIDPQLVQNVSDPLEKSLLNQFKLVYQSGKGSRRLVPVLIPNDTVEPLRILVQKREQCGIPQSNIFLFPSTGISKDHVSGWNIMKDVTNLVDGLERPELLIADKFRHRASTLFALTEVPEEKRHAFYKHMGHSQQINRDVYQCPLAVKEVTQVGKLLDTLDQETHETPETHAPDQETPETPETHTVETESTED